jgi:hypothetical protein
MKFDSGYWILVDEIVIAGDLDTGFWMGKNEIDRN